MTRAARHALLLTTMGWVVVGVLLATDTDAAAAAGTSAGATGVTEHQRIASERAAAEARFAVRERECRTRFVVTSCVDEAKSERRDALDKLRARQLGADEVRRRERAAQRQSELAEKAVEDARADKERKAHAAAVSASGAASQPARIRISSPRRSAAPERAASAASGAAPRVRAADKQLGPNAHPVESAALRKEREERSRSAFDKRQQAAIEHREESTTATVRRMASKSPAAPLPAPSAASATKAR